MGHISNKGFSKIYHVSNLLKHISGNYSKYCPLGLLVFSNYKQVYNRTKPHWFFLHLGLMKCKCSPNMNSDLHLHMQDWSDDVDGIFLISPRH